MILCEFKFVFFHLKKLKALNKCKSMMMVHLLSLHEAY